MTETLAKYFKGDKVIWAVIVFLTIISLVSVYSSIGELAFKKASGDPSRYFFKHVLFIILGYCVLYFVHRIPYKNFFNISSPFIVLSVVLLVATIAFGTSENDAARWLRVPGTSIGFQTSDIAKIALAAYIARILSGCQDNPMESELSFKKIMIAILVVSGLIMPSNLSTALMIYAGSVILMFVGRIPVKRIMSAFAVLLAAGILVTILGTVFPKLWRFGTWKNRIVTFVIGGNEDSTYQTNYAKAAIATSGLVGKLPGNSSVRYSLPYAYSDFIYAIIIEEWGAIVAILVLLAYLALLYRTGLIVKASSRTFPAFLAIGLSINLVLQAMVHMAVSVGLFPVTGQTLPIVSHGGTSMIITFMSLGVILSISRSLKMKEEAEGSIHMASSTSNAAKK
jgi:cell division protein FtsW